MFREDRDARAPPASRGTTSWSSTEYTPEPAGAPKNERLQGWGRDEPAGPPKSATRSRGYGDKDDWSVPLPRDDRLELFDLHLFERLC